MRLVCKTAVPVALEKATFEWNQSDNHARFIYEGICMKLSCLPVSFFSEIIDGSMPVEEWAAMGESLGLEGIDLSILFLKSMEDSYLRRMRAGIEETGIHVVVLNTYPDLTHPDQAVREYEQEKLKAHIGAAGLLGAEMVRVTAGQAHPETDRSRGIEWAVEGLRAAAGWADSSGVTAVYENHSKPGVWQYPDFSYPSDIFLQIADHLGDTSLGILFDTANPVSRGEDPLPILKKVIDRVRCLHAADTATAQGLRPVLLGTGLVPFDDIFSFLKCSGYEGWISIEEASGLGIRGVKEAVRFVRDGWNMAGGIHEA